MNADPLKEFVDLALQPIPEGGGRRLIEFHSPAQCRAYQPPPGSLLVGENHIVKGAVFVIGGAPGVGKSRAAVALAVAGASGAPWFGARVHRRFKTMIIQNENGALRLRDEFSELTNPDFETSILISSPPPYGMLFENPQFCSQVSEAIAQFQPDVVLLDPWNAVTRDEKAKEYLATFQSLRSVIPAGDAGPALGIVAHTRKPKAEERSSGRGLMLTLAGSYVLGSVPRSVFVLQAASDDPEDDRVVFTCCKNNDGPLGAPGAWQRRNGLFAQDLEFDWERFSAKSDARHVVLTETHLRELFQNGSRHLSRSHAAQELQAETGACRAACYSALKADGRFGHLITDEWRDAWLGLFPLKSRHGFLRTPSDGRGRLSTAL